MACQCRWEESRDDMAINLRSSVTCQSRIHRGSTGVNWFCSDVRVRRDNATGTKHDIGFGNSVCVICACGVLGDCSVDAGSLFAFAQIIFLGS